jgi:Phosphotransferase enzyme family
MRETVVEADMGASAVKTDNLPLDIDGLTPEWLGGAFDQEVIKAEVTDVIWGTATKVFVAVEYAEPSPDGPPQQICVKGGFQDELRAFGVAQSYVVEATFYEQVAPGLDAEIPRTWFTGVDPAVEQGIIIFDDLRADGCTFGDPETPMTADGVANTLELIATWHAASAAGALRTSGLTTGSPAVRATADILFTDAHWQQQAALNGTPAIPAALDDPSVIHNAFRSLWAIDDAGAQWLSHGDTHIGNTYNRSDGAPGFLDWQVACLAPPMYDVAYFVGGALEPDDRRVHEDQLLKHYLAALVAAGGPELDWNTTWLDYRRHAMHGFFWAVTPPVMQTIQRVAAMGRRHIAMIEDFETLDALAT